MWAARLNYMITLCRFAVLLALPAALSCQTLSAPPSKTGRATPGTFSLILEAPEDKALAALQWEFSVPPAIAVAKDDIAPGKAAESAGKSLTCARKADQGGAAGAVRYACILAGGERPIAQGPIAVVRYRAQTDVHGAPIRVHIEKALGVSADLKRIEIADTDAIITIQ